MKHLSKRAEQTGQAMTEMLICMPLLLFLIAGVIQLFILFASRVQFEHSCGEAARQYCAGLIDKDSLGPKIYETLGPYQKYFDPRCLTVISQEPKTTADQTLDKVRNAVQFIPFTVDYDGCEWAVDAKCTPPLFLKIIFPNGINFHSVMQVYRYPR